MVAYLLRPGHHGAFQKRKTVAAPAGYYARTSSSMIVTALSNKSCYFIYYN